jgi:hypothetical protein
MAKDKAPAKIAKAAVEPRHDPGWERVSMVFLAVRFISIYTEFLEFL